MSFINFHVNRELIGFMGNLEGLYLAEKMISCRGINILIMFKQLIKQSTVYLKISITSILNPCHINLLSFPHRILFKTHITEHGMNKLN
jgi:hypothetical protein